MAEEVGLRSPFSVIGTEVQRGKTAFPRLRRLNRGVNSGSLSQDTSLPPREDRNLVYTLSPDFLTATTLRLTSVASTSETLA